MQIKDILKEEKHKRVSWARIIPLFKNADWDKSFFHCLNGQAWRWIVPVGEGALIFPVNPDTPMVDVLSESAFQDDLKEFEMDSIKQTELANMKQINTRARIKELLKG